jgi:transposase
VTGQIRLIAAVNGEIDALGEAVAGHLGRHRDAEIYLSQPGLGPVLSARVLAEFGDDPDRFADAKGRKNYAGSSPITRAPPAPAGSCSPATRATDGSATRCTSGRSAR